MGNSRKEDTYNEKKAGRGEESMRVRVCVCLHACMYVCLRVCECVGVHACACVCVSVCLLISLKKPDAVFNSHCNLGFIKRCIYG